MSEMYFNSILIADIVAHKARFQEFEKGLNVVTSADNHVGKSSLLKSLYHSLGANVKYDNVWSSNTKLYILNFSVDYEKYKIVRQARSFAVFKGTKLLLITSKVVSELAPLLERIFCFGVYLDSKGKGKVTLAPPAFTFLPYYIDQDDGWNKLYGSFQNQEQYEKKDRIKSLYYHLNIYTKKSVELMAQRDHLQDELAALKKSADRLVEIIDALSEEMQGLVPADNITQFNWNIKIPREKIRDLVDSIGKCRNRIQELQISLEQHQHQLQVITEYHTIAHLASGGHQELSKSCPRCGYLFDEEIYNRVHSNFMNVNDSYVMQYISQVIASIEGNMQEEKERYISLMAELKRLEVTFADDIDGFNLYTRQRGMSESVDRFNAKLKDNGVRQSEIQMALNQIKKELRSLPNRKEIEDKYIEFTRQNIIKLGAWNPAYEGSIKLLTPIKAQGTLENKIILAQFVGLFQTMEYFKMQIIRFPFVVDSPRGKEASQESSKEILSMIADIKMLPQVILATIDFDEYKDGLGNVAQNANIITLEKRNSLLSDEDYKTYETEITEMIDLFKACTE